ncbi:MAG: DUF4783 domain-containing protein [Saprospiraceae bacterium]
MKNLVLLFLFTIIGTVANAQFSGISSAISNQNASELSKFFDTQVEITTPDKDDIFSKAEATDVMKSFFTNYKVTSFKLQHQGSSKGKSSEYAIGDMVASGKKFRVFIYISEKSGSTLIEQIQFEQD